MDPPRRRGRLILWALDNRGGDRHVQRDAPNPVTNREFSKALGGARRRPRSCPSSRSRRCAARSWPSRSLGSYRRAPAARSGPWLRVPLREVEPALRDLLSGESSATSAQLAAAADSFPVIRSRVVSPIWGDRVGADDGVAVPPAQRVGLLPLARRVARRRSRRTLRGAAKPTVVGARARVRSGLTKRRGPGRPKPKRSSSRAEVTDPAGGRAELVRVAVGSIVLPRSRPSDDVRPAPDPTGRRGSAHWQYEVDIERLYGHQLHAHPAALELERVAWVHPPTSITRRCTLGRSLQPVDGHGPGRGVVDTEGGVGGPGRCRCRPPRTPRSTLSLARRSGASPPERVLALPFAWPSSRNSMSSGSAGDPPSASASTPGRRTSERRRTPRLLDGRGPRIAGSTADPASRRGSRLRYRSGEPLRTISSGITAFNPGSPPPG